MTMDPELHYRLAVQQIAEARRQAERARAARSRSPKRQLRIIEAVRIRLAFLLVQIGLHLLARSRRTSSQGKNEDRRLTVGAGGG
jgi:hypothetical protein